MSRLLPSLALLGSYRDPTRLLAHCRFVLFCFFVQITNKAAVFRFEEAVIEGGPIALPGAQALLSQIDAGSSPSACGWTIVTSGTCPISLAFYSQLTPQMVN